MAAWLRNLVRYLTTLELRPGRGYRIVRQADGSYSLSIDAAAGVSSPSGYPFQLYKTGDLTYAIRKGVINLPLVYPTNTTPRDIDARYAFVPLEVCNQDGSDLSFTLPGDGYYDISIVMVQAVSLLTLPDYQVSPWVVKTTSTIGGADGAAAFSPVVSAAGAFQWQQSVSYPANTGTFYTQFPIAHLTSTSGSIEQYPRTNVAGVMVDQAMHYTGKYNANRVYFPGDVCIDNNLLLYMANGSISNGIISAFIGTEPYADTSNHTAIGTRWIPIRSTT